MNRISNVRIAVMTMALAFAALPAPDAVAEASAASPAAPASPSPGFAPSIDIVKLPYPSDAIDATYDKAGTLHVTFQRGKAFNYTARAAGSTDWKKPQELGQLPANAEPELAPQIAAWPNGNVAVAWKAGGKILLSVSQDGGKSFQAVDTDKLLTEKSKVEVPTVVIGGDGALNLFWVDKRDGPIPTDDVGAHLYLATSTNFGKTWSEPHAITKSAKRACPCCRPALAAGPGQELWAAYRSSDHNLKEIAVLHSTDGGQSWSVKQISEHKWMVKGCPASGPTMAVSGGKLALAWLSDASLFVTSSTDDGKSFGQPVKMGSGFFHQAAIGTSAPVVIFERDNGMSAWKAGDASPSKIDAPSKGTLVTSPEGKLELVEFERGEE